MGIDRQVCIISSVIGINKEKEISVPKEYISCHCSERTNMATKCKIFAAVT